MSNELAVLMQNHPAIVGTGLDEDTKAVAGGDSSKRISIKGGVFRLFAGGKEIASIEDRHMNVIFVKMSHNPSRNYYKDAYVEGAKVSPACWSEDSKVPHPDVKNPISSSCSTCPKAMKGTGTGGQGAACRLSWRTAVVLPNNPSGDVLQLVIPSASCWGDEDNGRWPFKAYIKMLAAHNVSAGRVVTKMQFDTKATAPKLLFSPAGVVATEDYSIIADQAKSRDAEGAVKLMVYQAKDGEGAEEASTESILAAASSGTGPVEAEPVAHVSSTEGKVEPEVADVVKKWAKKKT